MEKEEKIAVALKYKKEENNAPKVVAKGKGEVANNIILEAKKSGVAIKEDKELAEILFSIEIEKEIPPALYEVVAKILAFVYKEKKKL
jgi:flagellar biosynthesis protein